MLKCLIPILVVAAVLPAVCQHPSSNYQPGTILAVAPHSDPNRDPDLPRYDVTLKVGNIVYVVVYSPPRGQRTVEYAAGMEILVLVTDNSIRFTKLGTTAEVPITSREALPIDRTIDWSKAPGQYFSMKMQNLTESLSLTDDQRSRIRPIAEQEAGELGYLWGNPVISDKEKLKHLEKVVRSSDAKIKPILSPEQLTKLNQMRAEQRQELNTLIANRQKEKRD